MKSLSIKGIVLGLLTVFIMDFISGIGLVLLFATDTSQESVAKIYTNSGALIFSMFFGTLSTIVGGFVAAKIGNIKPYNNALAIGVIGIVMGILLRSEFPIWFNILAFAITIPAAMVGAFFVARKKL
jgi:hypothetical protein